MTKLECIHVDTCSPDYWGGHHLPHVSIPIYGAMSLPDIKRALKSEIHQGAVCGSIDSKTLESPEWFKRSIAAVNRIKGQDPKKRKYFTDIPVDDDSDYSVYAYFVFRECE